MARFGFTATELERRKSEAMRYFERAVTEKETEDSAAYAEEFTRPIYKGLMEHWAGDPRNPAEARAPGIDGT